MDALESLNKLSGKKVLVVDDNIDNQILECTFISRLGAFFEVASNGLEAFEKAIKGDHDIILMDLHMPVLDGINATKKLRNAGFEKPIIAVTADTQDSTKSRAFEVGFDDFLGKPIHFGKMLKALIRIFEPDKN